MRLRDLLADPDGTLSSSKLWANVGHAAMTAAFLNHSLRYELSPELLFAYGVIVAGSQTANRLLKLKFHARRPD